MAPTPPKTLRLLIHGGDSMLGRAVNLSCPHRIFGDEHIVDSMPSAYYLKASLHPGTPDAGTPDLSLAEIREWNRNGRYLWGDYLGLNIDPPPRARLLNLETSVVNSIGNSDVPIWKGINYHLGVENFRGLIRGFAQEKHGGEATIPYVVCLANNHAMDFGRKAFDAETLPRVKEILAEEGEGSMAGAGRDFAEAARPAVVPLENAPEIRVFSMATECSGTPRNWQATPSASGLVWLPSLVDDDAVEEAFQIARRALGDGSSGDRLPNKTSLRVVSIHWGPNWAYRGSAEEEDDGQSFRRKLAHRLIDELNVDLVYGHSSHHVRGMELHAGKLVLYGAGDLINDYEGFANPGDERYCKMGAVFLANLLESNGDLKALYLLPTFMNRLRLCRWKPSSSIWDPLQRRMVKNPKALEQFRDCINRLSKKDAGENGMQLRMMEHDDAIPDSGPLLVYP